MAKLTKENLVVLARNTAKVDSAYSTSDEFILYPFRDYETGEDKLATAFVTHHSNPSESKEHTTVLAFTGDDEFYVWCGDKLLEGKLEADEASERINGALDCVPEENRDRAESQMIGGRTFSQNTACGNIRLASNLKRSLDAGKTMEEITNSSTSVTCKHIQNMFAQMPDIEGVVKILERNHKDIMKVSKIKKSDSAIVDVLVNFGFQGESVLALGPGGHGKTHEFKSYASDNKFNLVEFHGHGQVEAIDMYGYERKHGDTFVWFDGPISQAARQAAKGVKTILFIDEMLNIPQRELAGLKACFEPYKGHYYFQTSRIASVEDGIATMEMIEVPVENLQIVCAANIGSGYSSEDIEKAFKQRFIIVYHEAQTSKVKSVLESICDSKGFSRNCVDKLMDFQRLLNLKVEEGVVEEKATMRHLSRKILELAKEEDDLEYVATTQILQFVDFDIDGRPVAEQVEVVEEVIEATIAA